MLIGQDEQSDGVKGTPASNLSPSQPLILLVERDDVQTESEFDCTVVHEYGKKVRWKCNKGSKTPCATFFPSENWSHCLINSGEVEQSLLLESKFNSSGQVAIKGKKEKWEPTPGEMWDRERADHQGLSLSTCQSYTQRVGIFVWNLQTGAVTWRKEGRERESHFCMKLWPSFCWNLNKNKRSALTQINCGCIPWFDKSSQSATVRQEMASIMPQYLSLSHKHTYIHSPTCISLSLFQKKGFVNHNKVEGG